MEALTSAIRVAGDQLDKCIVTDEKVGDHGKPYVFTPRKAGNQTLLQKLLEGFQERTVEILKEDREEKEIT